MTIRQVDELVWDALTDSEVRERLLGGQELRTQVLQAFGFSEDERQTVLAVRADTLEAFAGALCQPGIAGS
jgi:adenylylsulfate kinase-like enzyme